MVPSGTDRGNWLVEITPTGSRAVADIYLCVVVLQAGRYTSSVHGLVLTRLSVIFLMTLTRAIDHRESCSTSLGYFPPDIALGSKRPSFAPRFSAVS